LNPAPLFLLGAGSKRGTRTSEKSRRRDASTRRGVCSVSAVTQGPGEILPAEGNKHPLLARRFQTSVRSWFSTKKGKKITAKKQNLLGKTQKKMRFLQTAGIILTRLSNKLSADMLKNR